MAGSSSPCPDDNDCLRLPATSTPCIRGAEKKESTGLRLSQPCPPYVTPSSISSFGRRLNGVHTAGNKSMKNSGANTFCQSSANKSKMGQADARSTAAKLLISQTCDRKGGRVAQRLKRSSCLCCDLESEHRCFHEARGTLDIDIRSDFVCRLRVP